MKTFAADFFVSLVTMLLVAIIPLLIYAIRKCGAEFTVRGFLLSSRRRLGLGFLLMMLLTLIVTWFPAARTVFGVAAAFIAGIFGVPAATTDAAGVSDVALGLIVGGLLVAAIHGDKP